MALNSRKRRFARRRADMQESRIVNGHKKRKERVRRDSLMIELVKKSHLPYTPAILSWLSSQLDIPGRLITQADVSKITE